MKKISVILLLPLLAASCSALRQSSPNAANPGDELVNVGYGNIRRNAITGSVGKVKMDNIRTYNTIYEFLQGKVPGVSVSGTTIRIRGISSINSSNDPLILVDGIEMSDISALNPHDVDSVEVLKDSSAAIYGIRGANGVILIKTKRAE